MAGLYHVNERRLYKFHELTIGGRQKRRYAIGRAPRCDVCVTDKTVSSVHCWITKRDDGTFLLEDNGSSNGVRILGAHVQSLVLVRSMRLLLGNTEIVVVGSDERVASPGALPIRSCTTRP